MIRKSSHCCRNRARRPGTSNSATPNGFTLMELLIVMAIIAILSLLAIASISVYQSERMHVLPVNSLQKIGAGADDV